MDDILLFFCGAFFTMCAWYFSVNSDRSQYRSGYKNGYADGLKEVGGTDIIRCEECAHKFDDDCPMIWGKGDKEYCSWGERE